MKSPYLLMATAIALVYIGAGCVGSNKISQLDKQTQDLRTQTQIAQEQAIFDRRAKCAQEMGRIDEEIKAYNIAHGVPQSRPQNNTLSDDDPEQTHGLYLDRESLVEVFYSPKLNTCVADILNDTYMQGEDGGWSTPFYESHEFNDALTGKAIDFVQIIQRGEYWGEDGYRQKLKELKE